MNQIYTMITRPVLFELKIDDEVQSA